MTELQKFEKRILITGGAGFIGSNLLHYLVPKYPKYLFVNADCLTYAGNLSNLVSLEKVPNYLFEKIDIRNFDKVLACFDKYDFDGLIHLAAESHVDRSITGPAEFVQTNIMGTFNLLEASRRKIASGADFRFHHVSTDEVFGSLGESGYFTETTPYNPNSPYSATKAGSDHLVRAYHKTYGLNVVTMNCSNNYGPYQFPEKLIPLMIRNAKAGLGLPVYGDGRNIRDWLYVEDHCRAIDLVFHRGKTGETYNIGGHNEIENIELVRLICRMMDDLLGGEARERLITYVKDRPGHDRRYAIDASYIEKELGWKPLYSFEKGIRKTVEWYLENEIWLENCISGQYLKYYENMYLNRG
ncbi:dTDP-glucose 4,6 dehydratase, NAD(P)-binding [Candidatus Zixiibacteriota bacterium]|nr:dTDP-glucose 4,6 dehydratase, NAD(P)-binding [candidate division Zixibacteria bacterium]